VSEAPQKFRTGAILKTSSGFGGVNVALLLESAAGADA
jgi:3-oxoacyl-(acyl-carrier-protein) synthase